MAVLSFGNLVPRGEGVLLSIFLIQCKISAERLRTGKKDMVCTDEATCTDERAQRHPS